MSETKEQILKIRDLDITFQTTAGSVHAIRGVNIDLMKGETVAIVGESGSGKSVTMKAAMGILASNAKVTGGTIEFSYHHADGTPQTVDILTKDKKWIRRHINGKRIAMVFQDPMTSLDPTMTIGKQIMEGMIWHFKTPKKEAWDKAVELLKEVGIEDAEKRMKNYPHQLSGGMRQRAIIALATFMSPGVVLADEPTTALDVVVQKGILMMLMRLQKQLKNTMIIVSHDMGVHYQITDRMAIMYSGSIAELGKTEDIFNDPINPYTKMLVDALPRVGEDVQRVGIAGRPPALKNPPPGCRFAPRCPHATDRCRSEVPKFREIRPGRFAACHLLEEEVKTNG